MFVLIFVLVIAVIVLGSLKNGTKVTAPTSSKAPAMRQFGQLDNNVLPMMHYGQLPSSIGGTFRDATAMDD